MPISHNRKGRSRTERFAKLPFYMIDSPAWRSLTPQARSVYIELLRRYRGTNNGDISLSVREAADLCRICKDTANRCFDELKDKGFISCRQKGSFNRKVRHASEWELTDQPYDVNKPTKDFLLWRAEKKKTRS